ncbi:serine/threonine protein kinase [Lecanora helva]
MPILMCYIATNTVSGEELAIKLEDLGTEHPRLESETRIYHSLAGGVGIPWVHWSKTECNYKIMALDLLGPSLENLFEHGDRRFSLKTILLITDQLITRIEYIHAKSFIYGAIKPDNFLIGTGKMSDQIHVIGFGFATECADDKAHSIDPQAKTTQCASFQHFSDLISYQIFIRQDQKRRDDLESLGYLMLYFFQSSLPWHKFLPGKKTTPVKTLCHGIPNEFATYLSYARSLTVNDKPDYAYIRKIFRDLFIRRRFEYEDTFDWATRKYQRLAQESGDTLRDSLSPEDLRGEVNKYLEELSTLEVECKDRHEYPSAVMETTSRAKGLDLSASEWQSFRGLHQRLLATCYDLLAMANHPSAPEDIKSTRQQDTMPHKLIYIGILPFLNAAKYQLPESLDHMFFHINYAFTLLQDLLRRVPEHRGVWLSCTRQLAWYTLFGLTGVGFALTFIQV